MSLLAYEQLDWGQAPERLVIWLHGLGASGDDFVPVIPELQLPKTKGIRFIFPHAPSMPVTLNRGYVMPAWYDIYDLNRNAKEDKVGILDSVNALEQLISHFKAQGFNEDKMVLAGFSQGGVIALMTALSRLETLAGVMGLSTYFPKDLGGINIVPFNQQNTSILIAHGTFDEVVPLGFSKERSAWLNEKGYKVQERLYPMGHEVCAREIKDISSWLVDCLGLAE